MASKRKRRKRNTSAPATVTRDTNTVDDISDDEDKKPSAKDASGELEDDNAPADDLDQGGTDPGTTPFGPPAVGDAPTPAAA